MNIGGEAEDTGGAPVSAQLTSVKNIQMQLIAPPPVAASLVTTFFRLRCDDNLIRDVQPSSLGIFAIMARGSGTLNFIDGGADPSCPLTLVTPTNAAATFVVDGPWDVFGAMLSPVGWASLTGWSAKKEGNRLHDAAKVLPPTLIARAQEVLHQWDGLSNEEMRDKLSGALAASAAPLRESHLHFIRAISGWLSTSLSPDVGSLASLTGLSARQVQRLTERYFGLTPKALARKYRALRAAVLLSRPELSPDELMAIQDHFYDQSHMIREIRLFSGRTPARVADPDTPYLASFLRMRDFQGSSERMAPIPKDLRA
jgi:AraC-like DNA-binding protein